MYEYLIGTISDVMPDAIVVNVGGVGYRVQVANPYSYDAKQEKIKVFIYQSVREDAIALFGFHSQSEKQLFTKLINVSGIGPKSALAILANPDHQGLVEAIANNDVNYLSKFPGIGKKTASRIIIELQDKVDTLLPNSLLQPQISKKKQPESNAALDDALAALKSLGYTQRDVNRVKKSLQNASVTTTDQYLRKALTILN